MDAEAINQSIVYETRLLRMMVLVDIAATECDALLSEGYNQQAGKMGETLHRFSESIAHMVNAERDRRVQPPSGIVTPFRHN
jgi:hypothetical protein